MRWRLLLESGDAATNMAIDEALMRFGIPTVRFYRFKPSSVTIGYFQRVNSAVNLEEARKLGVKVVRRATGGGSVYHDEEGELTYSVVASESLFPKGFAESMRHICEGVVRTIRSFGLKAEFSGVNDVVVAGRKLSGSAQAREQGILLQHGTIMYATDLEKLASLLLAPKEKLSDKGVSSILERVTTISRELRRSVSFNEVL
ncbi:MAG: lipoate--protein ligase family protein, partial [Candidatus Korarchaeum sp.]|nr:lipoate--protein ligase family protein [Candidatus Korarchaeum sp.]